MDEHYIAQFGQRVRDLRKCMGLSQDELAAKASMDRSYFGAIERGEHNISLKNILKIADALAVHPSTLFPKEG